MTRRYRDRLTIDDDTRNNVEPIGTLENIREYASAAFYNDKDQCKAFELIVATFLVEVHNFPEYLMRSDRG